MNSQLSIFYELSILKTRAFFLKLPKVSKIDVRSNVTDSYSNNLNFIILKNAL